MNVKITTLTENTVPMSKGLIGEHGISFLIETDSNKILFDTGQGLALINNAMVLGVDLKKINTVVLSHGHYDHTGGLKNLLEYNAGFTLFAHPESFSNKLAELNGKYLPIGSPVDMNLLEKKGVNLRLGEKPSEIAPGIIASGKIPMQTEFENIEPVFFKKYKTKIIPDDLADDQVLIINSEKGIIVLLGCCHRGLINTLLMAIGITKEPLTFLLYNQAAVVITLTYIAVPFVFIPLYTVLEKIPKNLIDAANDLGANEFRTFIHVILPISSPGLLTGFMLSFLIALGDYIIPQQLGGAKGFMFGNIIWSQFGSASNWPFGSVLGFVLFFIAAIILVLSQRFGYKQGTLLE